MSSPADAPGAVISTPPALAVITIALAPSLDEAIFTSPVVSKSRPPVPASISIPPAVSLAFNVIADASASVDVIFTEEPVAVTLMSSPAAAPGAVISTPPALAVITIALAPPLDEAIFTSPVVSTSTPAVPASISIPPAASLAFNLIADASASVDVIFTEEPVAVTLMSSPAAAPGAVISTPPALAVIIIALAPSLDEAIFTSPVVSTSTPPVPASISIPPAESLAFNAIADASASVDVIFTEEPVAVILISSPAAAPVAVISTPPALAVNTKALAPSLDEAIFTSPVESISTPPVPASRSKNVAPVALPIVIVLSAAPVPIFIFCATASLPILINPAEEFNERAPALSISKPVDPSCLMIASFPSPNLICAELLFRAIFPPKEAS